MIKKLRKTWNKYFSIKLLITLVLLLISLLTIPITLAPSFPVLAWITYITRGKVGVAMAGFIIGFEFYYLGPGSLRAWIVSGSAFILAWLVAKLKRDTLLAMMDKREAEILAQENREKAEFVNGLNGNLRQLRIVHDLTNNLLNSWYQFDDIVRVARVTIINEHITNLLTVVSGWHAMAVEKKLVIEDEGRKQGLFD